MVESTPHAAPLGRAGCQGLGMGLQGKPPKCLPSDPRHLCFLRGACPGSGPSPPVPHGGTHLQDVGEQGRILLDLGAEDGGELHLLLFCEGSRNCPTKPEKFLEAEQDRNREARVAGKREGFTPRRPLASWPLTCTGLWTLR